MNQYIAVPQTRTHALLLAERLKAAGVNCGLCYIPGQIASGPCNMGVRFGERYLAAGKKVIRESGLPGCQLYLEIIHANNCEYHKVAL